MTSMQKGSGIFIVNIKHISIVDFEQNADWEGESVINLVENNKILEDVGFIA